MKNELVIAGKVEKLWDFLVFLKEKEPHVFDSAHILRQRVAMRWKQLLDSEHCPNCGANMCVKEYTAGILQMMLLNRLGEIVMYRAARTESFGDANNVHLDTTNIETSLKSSSR